MHTLKLSSVIFSEKVHFFVFFSHPPNSLPGLLPTSNFTFSDTYSVIPGYRWWMKTCVCALPQTHWQLPLRINCLITDWWICFFSYWKFLFLWIMDPKKASKKKQTRFIHHVCVNRVNTASSWMRRWMWHIKHFEWSEEKSIMNSFDIIWMGAGLWSVFF